MIKYFYKHQSEKNNLEEVAVMDDTVFGLDKKNFYITFTYPKHQIILYVLGITNNEKYVIDFDDDYYIDAKWKDFNKLERYGIDEIISVNNIFTDNEYIFLSISKNRIKSKRDINTRDYMVVIDIREGVAYDKIVMKYGTIVYYDNEKKYFYSLLKNTDNTARIYKWKLIFKI
jgi:hypothetical protein